MLRCKTKGVFAGNGIRPVALETHSETPRFHGACYRAANWVYIGQAQSSVEFLCPDWKAMLNREFRSRPSQLVRTLAPIQNAEKECFRTRQRNFQRP